MKEARLRFRDNAKLLECVGLVGHVMGVVAAAAKTALIDNQKEVNTVAEYNKALYINSGTLLEENTNQSVPYICKGCHRIKGCDHMVNSTEFAKCSRKVFHDLQKGRH